MGCCCSNGAKGDNWKDNNGQYGGRSREDERKAGSRGLGVSHGRYEGSQGRDSYGGKRSREEVKGHSWGWGVSYGGDGGGSYGGDGGGSCGGDGGGSCGGDGGDGGD